MKKLYFATEDSENCYPLAYMLELAKEEGMEEIELFEAIPDKVDGYFYCRAVGATGEDGDCGKACTLYEPRNGKSGICKHKGRLYMPGDLVKFKIK